MRIINPQVDLVILTRRAGPLRSEVHHGIHSQEGVQLTVHRVVGDVWPGDVCRWDAIARARNEGKLRGRSAWLMFLDDDVELAPECIAKLVEELSRRPLYGAIAADYLGQQGNGRMASHVTMGATLFRRQAVDEIRFAWRNKTCECQCCCDDLRRLHWAIDYCPAAKARHLPKMEASESLSAEQPSGDPLHETPAPRVLAAFNRRHFRQFCKRFLGSLRAAGNQEIVVPVASGLSPGERDQLARCPGVQPAFRSEDHQFPGRSRLRQFTSITRALPPATPAAYWDAGDVIFQASLQPLWELVRTHPGKILAVREPAGHPENSAVVHWTQSIADPGARRDAQQLLFHNPFINSGFLAGTAGALTEYLDAVRLWYDTPKLLGSTDPGDQVALNVYCHLRPDVWHEISDSWNYCLWWRQTCYRREDGLFVDRRGVPIYVVHGNAKTLDWPRYRRKPSGSSGRPMFAVVRA